MSAQFLIATSKLAEDPFHKSIVYLCHHQNHSGSIGLIINKTRDDVKLSGVLNQLEIEHLAESDDSVFMGGPVHSERGMIIYKPSTPESPANSLGLSYSKALLNNIIDGEGPNDFFLTLGHASWEPWQLQNELENHLWLLYETHSSSIRDELLFFTPVESRYQLACELMGFRPQQLSWQSGRA